MSSNPIPIAITALVFQIAMLAESRPVSAQPLPTHSSRGAQASLTLPTRPFGWLNSPPLESERLLGKGVVLWFFEEGCPRCIAKWTELYEIERQFQSQPVLFVAVNSGTSRNELARYLERANCRWPVICDEDRGFEKACGVPEISLNNIMQCRYIAADGSMQIANWNDVAGAARSALKRASWSLDESKVPPGLRDVSKDIEFGIYPRAIERLKQEYRNPEARAQTQYLVDVVKQHAIQAARDVEAQLTTMDSSQKYLTIQSYEERFRGLPRPKFLTDAKLELSKSADAQPMLRTSGSTR